MIITAVIHQFTKEAFEVDDIVLKSWRIQRGFDFQKARIQRGKAGSCVYLVVVTGDPIK